MDLEQDAHPSDGNSINFENSESSVNDSTAFTWIKVLDFHSAATLPNCPKSAKKKKHVSEETDEWDGEERNWIFRCVWQKCGLEFDEDFELKSHLLEKHFKEQQCSGFIMCKVEGCDFTSHDADSLKRHINFHAYHANLQLKGWQYRCRSHPKILHCNADMTKIVHPNQVYYAGEVLQCMWDNCFELFDDVSVYFNHVNRHFSSLVKSDRDDRDQLYHCRWEGCDKTVHIKSELRHHQNHHSGAKSFACPFCGTFLASQSKMGDHLLRNSVGAAGRLKCFLCQKTFATERLLREHSRRHVKHYKCSMCDMTVECPSDLRRHMQIRHTDHKPYPCSQCTKAFFSAPDLERHMTKHLGKKDAYKCEICDRGFKWKHSLKMHLKRHETLEPLYLCHLCNKRYVLGTNLGSHLVSAHKLVKPSGHQRFSYKKCSDGYFRLQTERYESKDLAAAMEFVEQNAGAAQTAEVINHMIEKEAERTGASPSLIFSKLRGDAVVGGINPYDRVPDPIEYPDQLDELPESNSSFRLVTPDFVDSQMLNPSDKSSYQLPSSLTNPPEGPSLNRRFSQPRKRQSYVGGWRVSARDGSSCFESTSVDGESLEDEEAIETIDDFEREGLSFSVRLGCPSGDFGPVARENPENSGASQPALPVESAPVHLSRRQCKRKSSEDTSVPTVSVSPVKSRTTLKEHCRVSSPRKRNTVRKAVSTRKGVNKTTEKIEDQFNAGVETVEATTAETPSVCVDMSALGGDAEAKGKMMKMVINGKMETVLVLPSQN